jgi:hypothetical protein
MTGPPSLDTSRAAWRKSRRSANAGNCVEVAANLTGIVAVRDSKNPDGPKLIITPGTWGKFTVHVKAQPPSQH